MTGIAGTVSWLRTEAQIFLAATQPGDYDPVSTKGPEWGKAAPVALLMILLMAIALFFLIKSMGKQLKKIPPHFDPPADETASAPVDKTAGSEQKRPDLKRSAAPPK